LGGIKAIKFEGWLHFEIPTLSHCKYKLGRHKSHQIWRVAPFWNSNTLTVKKNQDKFHQILAINLTLEQNCDLYRQCHSTTSVDNAIPRNKTQRTTRHWLLEKSRHWLLEKSREIQTLITREILRESCWSNPFTKHACLSIL